MEYEIVEMKEKIVAGVSAVTGNEDQKMGAEALSITQQLSRNTEVRE